MRLLNVQTLAIKDFPDTSQIEYAIVSHRWEEEEVLYKDMVNLGKRARKMKGFHKIEMSCRQAVKNNLEWIWMDTCCIDKSSSAELQEAVNSMFKWYAQAQCCYAYLSDVQGQKESMVKSKWFTRGWTLQELLAPRRVEFFNANWDLLGHRGALKKEIHSATGIRMEMLEHYGWDQERQPCVAEIMSWARNRATTRVEDRAYSLLGFFDVSMPLLYGEGKKAFLRLQEEILKSSEDQSIFAWHGVEWGRPSLLATSPDRYSAKFTHGNKSFKFISPSLLQRRKPHAVTNEGISLQVDLYHVQPRIYIGFLNLGVHQDSDDNVAEDDKIKEVYSFGIYLKQIDSEDRFVRVGAHQLERATDFAIVAADSLSKCRKRQISIVRKLRRVDHEAYYLEDFCGFKLFQPVLSALVWRQWSARTAVRCVSHQYRSYHDVWMQGEEGSGIFGMLHDMTGTGTLTKHVILPLVVLGFDLDFNPVCILSTKVLIEMNRRLLESVINQFDEYPDNRFSAQDSDKEALVLRSIEGGKGRNFGPSLLALKMQPQGTIDARTLIARIRIYLDDKKKSVWLRISRTWFTMPWDFLITTSYEKPNW